MSDSSIKAVLLDYGGVIADEGFQNGLRGLAAEQGLEPDAVLEVAKHAVYESGAILGWGTEADLWRQMRERSGLRGSDSELTMRVLNGFVLRPWMIELVRELGAQGYVTGILSDQTRWLDRLNERDRFFQYFDHVFNSYYMGKGKRDPSLFRDIAGKLFLCPAEILLVDDMNSNVLRAQEAGWSAIRYTEKAGFLEAMDAMLHRTRG